MIQLNSQQQDLFDDLFSELKALPPVQLRTRLAQVAREDLALAAVLQSALDEPPSLRSLVPDDVVGDCTLVERVSAGGCGEVWKANQRLAGGSSRLVAVKFIHPHLLMENVAKARHFLDLFHAEIAALAQFQHPYIVRLHRTLPLPLSLGNLEIPCYVMDYHESHPLHPTPYLPDRTSRLRCFLKVCDAVHCSHNHGRVHLDLKPDNIRVRPDREPILIDFGLSERLRPEQPVMSWRTGVGTLPYMAPEQLNGKHPVGKTTDVHALGVLLFQLIADRLPYNLRDSTEGEFRKLICDADRLSLLTCRADEDVQLAAILAKALERDAARRFADAGELRDSLAEIVEDTTLDSIDITDQAISVCTSIKDLLDGYVQGLGTALDVIPLQEFLDAASRHTPSGPSRRELAWWEQILRDGTRGGCEFGFFAETQKLSDFHTQLATWNSANRNKQLRKETLTMLEEMTEILAQCRDSARSKNRPEFRRRNLPSHIMRIRSLNRSLDRFLSKATVKT